MPPLTADRQTVGRTDKQTDGRPDGRTDNPTRVGINTVQSVHEMNEGQMMM